MTALEILFLILTGLQPGDRKRENVKNRFNGFSNRPVDEAFCVFHARGGKTKTVETVRRYLTATNHRAEARCEREGTL